MTDQKQAPERYSPAMLFSTQKPATMHKELHGEFVTYVAYAALAKLRDELYAEMQVWKLRCVKAESELKAEQDISNKRGNYIEFELLPAMADIQAERDELEEMNKNQEAMIRQADRRGDRLTAERDQALAASAAREIAMRDRAAEECMHHLTDEADEALADIWKERIEALPLSPDGQQALNEMLADAWDEGFTDGFIEPLGDGRDHNPYRKGAT